MSPERWGQIERIYHDALERDAAKRETFLAEVCGGDEELLSEVRGLLAQPSEVAALDAPAWAAGPARSGEVLPAKLKSGSMVGPYRIESILGAGGMAEVFRATDTRLGRQVAVKISQECFDARFQREARAIAALNHPNICTLYDVGPGYLVMELCEGETLEARLKRKVRLPLAICVDIAIQVGEALRTAHAKGIVHRDIKPGNIILTSENGVKVMDFGLALLADRSRLTKTGTVLGTPSYMSPEQARGQVADRRTDVWSLGVVLFEMIRGSRPFAGNDVSSLLARIVGDPPAKLSRQGERVPDFLEEVVRKTLAKDRGERYQHMDDLVVDLRRVRKEIQDPPERPAVSDSPDIPRGFNPETDTTLTLAPGPPVARTRNVRHLIALALAALLLALALASRWWR